MVDFQSRDTRRGASDDDDDPEDDAEAPDEDPPADSPAESADETAPEEAPDRDAETVSDDAATEHDGSSGSTADDGAGDPLAPDPVGEDEADTASAGHPGAADPADRDAESGGHGTGAGRDDTHVEGHDHSHAGTAEQLGVAVVTVSSSRTLDEDPSGDAIGALLTDEGHEIVTRELVADDLDGVQRAVLALTGRDDVDAVVTTGGTGVTPDDVTIEAVTPLFDKELPGFGELFRILSYEDVGTRAVGSRATAGVSEGVPVFCLPGSEAAVRLAVEELVAAEAGHLVELAQRGR